MRLSIILDSGQYFFIFLVVLFCELREMVSVVGGVQASGKVFDVKKVVIFVVAVCLFFSALFVTERLLSNVSDRPQTSEDTTVLTLALYQSLYHTQGDVTYEFRYVAGGQGNLVQVSLGGESVSYAAVSGSKLNPFDLKVTIYSATERMCVLHIA